MGYIETSRPKFTTITTPHPKPFVEQSLNDGSIINSTLHPVKQEEDDDSDLDIFVLFNLISGRTEQKGRCQKRG
jgi:hypothetical protein